MNASFSHVRGPGIRWARTTLVQALTRLASSNAEQRHRTFWGWGRWRLLLSVVVLALALPGVLGGLRPPATHPIPPPAAMTAASPSTTTISPGSSWGAGGPQAATIPADSCGITDIQQCLSDFINSFLSSIAQWWQTQVDNVSALGFVFFTPASVSYSAPIVQQIQAYSLTVVTAALALVFVIAGYNYMVGRSVTWTEVLPQIFFCGMMAFAIPSILVFAIDGSNDFLLGLQGVNLQNVLTNNTDTSTMGLIAFIFELILDLGLAIEALARLALLDLLLAIAPMGIFCFALPQTRTWGRLWAEGFVATLLIQPIQAVVVLIGSWFLANMTQLFGPNFPPIVQIMLGIACAFLAVRVPALLGRFTHYGTDLRGQVNRLVTALASGA